jgi:putative NADPH-quinone reductase
MILIILGHPAPHSLSDSLGHAYALGLRTAGVPVEILVLRDLDFQPNLRAGFSGEQLLEPDLRNAQLAIERAEHVAWFFPTWWAGPPALVKAFIDRAFLPGWAFDYQKNKALPLTRLGGRSARLVTTMDSPSFWYWLWHWRALHASFVNATLRFVGIGPVWTTTFYGQRSQDSVRRAAFIDKMSRLGERDGKVRLRSRGAVPNVVPNAQPGG